MTRRRFTTALSLALVSFILGVLTTFQLRTNNIVPGLRYDQSQQLTLQYNNLTKENAALESQVADLERSIAQAQAGRAGAVLAVKSELKEAEQAAGFTAVTGSGIKMTIDNVATTSTAGAGASLYIIRDSDLLNLVNELNAAGAEAISINGQRLITTSEIRLAGEHIDINLVPLTPPYHVLAIGDPGRLAQVLEITGGEVPFLQDLGVSVTVTKENKVVVPGYTGTPDLSSAKPVAQPARASSGG